MGKFELEISCITIIQDISNWHLTIYIVYIKSRTIQSVLKWYKYGHVSPRHICVPVPSLDLDFQRHMPCSFLQSVEVGGNWSFCWYWWNCWPILSKRSFHNWLTFWFLYFLILKLWLKRVKFMVFTIDDIGGIAWSNNCK